MKVRATLLHAHLYITCLGGTTHTLVFRASLATQRGSTPASSGSLRSHGSYSAPAHRDRQQQQQLFWAMLVRGARRRAFSSS